MLELSPAITRQYIDAVAVFDALAEAIEEAAQVRGGMYWHAGPPSAPIRNTWCAPRPPGQYLPQILRVELDSEA